MTLSEEIRARLLESFRAEVAEHIQTITDGLLALEQQTVPPDQRQELLEDLFRAAHSLKGAARAIGLTAIEQLAHALEDVLNGLQKNTLPFSSALCTACYQTLDAIRLVQALFESGSTTPPPEALQALTTLATFKPDGQTAAAPITSAPTTPTSTTPPTVSSPKVPVPTVPAPPAPVIDQLVQTVETSISGGTPISDGTPTFGETPTFGGTPTPIEPARETAPATVSDLAAGDETIRISTRRLDDLMTDLSELLVSKINAEQRQSQVWRAQALIADRRKSRAAMRRTTNRLAHYDHAREPSGTARHTSKDIRRVMKYLEEDGQRWRELDALLAVIARASADDLLHMSLTIDGLEESLKRARLLPLNTITGPFGRMVRDLAQGSGKEAALQLIGTEVELDKHLLERIKDPLIHLLRNAVDHGIETPAERSAHGKPPSGTVTLKVASLNRAVVIQVTDDGAGLNLAAIRDVAQRQGHMATAAKLDDAQLAELIFAPGFSTRTLITNTSGRGVGLDVVRRNIEALNGHVTVEWAAGRGTTFTLTVPLTLVSARGLLVRASGETFTIPLGAIDRVLRITTAQIISLGGCDALAWQGRTLLLVHLGDVLNLPRAQKIVEQQYLPVVIIAAAERRMALVVDEIIGEQEIVSRGLGKQLMRVGGIMGASVTASGEALLILNAADLIKLATGLGPRPLIDAATAALLAQPAPRHRIMVVDDSITTRSLEKNILEAAGYDVQLAVDGMEALELMANELPDLVISDVAMPHLDGLGLAQRIKSNEQMRHLPVILVTSLDSPEDKARGIEVGADAYIVKSGFDQSNLLETIQQLI